MSAPSVSLLQTGFVLDARYRVRHRLGVGACGVVYAAEQLGARRVALKVMHPTVSQNVTAFSVRFFSAAAAAAGLRHANTAALLDYGRTEEGRFFLVHELVTGTTLAERLWARGPLPPWCSI